MARVKADSELTRALTDACRAAWAFWRKKYPAERFYAFALCTTEGAESYAPSANGEDGLTRVAERYMAENAGEEGYRDLQEVRAGLRWSFADSPYQREGARFVKAIDAALAKRPEIYDLPERACEREASVRHESAVAALKALDEEGLFGTGAARDEIVLLIDGGDCESQFLLGYAKRLNPKTAYEAFERPFRFETKGRFVELGSRDVYQTRSVAASADGRLLVAGAQHEVFCFEQDASAAAGWKQAWAKRVRRGDYLVVDAVDVTADGGTVVGTYVSGGAPEYGVVVWRGRRWKESTMYPLPRGASPLDVAVAPDGTWVAVASQDKRVRVLSVADGAERAVLAGHGAWPRSVAASPNGRWLASAEGKGGVRLWDAATWALARRMGRPADGVAFSSDGRWLVSAVQFPEGPVGRAATTPEGRVALVWDVRDGRLAHEVRVPGWRIQRAVLSPDGSRVACGCEHVEDTLRHAALLVEVASGRVLAEMSADFEGIEDFAFLADGRIAVGVYGHHYKPVLLWEVSA